MTFYHVHLYREMKLRFDRIEAESPETAAAIARNRRTEDADDIGECDGETFAALVDVAGDEDFSRSRLIDFDPPENPVVVITVRDGAVQAVHATAPVTVFVEDWDCPPERPLVMDFESESLTPAQQRRIACRRAATINPTGEEP